MLRVTPTNSPSELLQKFALIADLELDAVADSSGKPHSKVSTRHTYCADVSSLHVIVPVQVYECTVDPVGPTLFTVCQHMPPLSFCSLSLFYMCVFG